MNRTLWFAAGAGASIYAMVKGRRAAETFTADGLRDRWHALGAGVRILLDEVAQGHAEKESELRRRIVERGELDPAKQIGSAGAVSAILGRQGPTEQEGGS